MSEYLKDQKLTWNIEEYESVLLEKSEIKACQKQSFDELRIIYVKLRQYFLKSKSGLFNLTDILFLVGFLKDYAGLWNDKTSFDLAEKLLKIVAKLNKF